MKYTLPASGQSRSTDYIGTTKDKNDEDVRTLKESVARHNRHVRSSSRKFGCTIGTLLRVRVKPRGPRTNNSYHTLTADATHFDIYQGEDTEAMHMLRREMETGLTPSELKQLDKLKNAAWRIEIKGIVRKRKKEMQCGK